MEKEYFYEMKMDEMQSINGGAGFWYKVGFYAGKLADRWANAMMKLCRS